MLRIVSDVQGLKVSRAWDLGMQGFVLRASGLGFVWGFGFMAYGCRMLPGLLGGTPNASNPDPPVRSLNEVPK